MEIRRIEAILPALKPKPFRTLPFLTAEVARLKRNRMLVRQVLTMHGTSFVRQIVFSFMPEKMPGRGQRASTYRIFAKMFRSYDLEMTNLNILVMEALAKSNSCFLLNCYVNSLFAEYSVELESWN